MPVISLTSRWGWRGLLTVLIGCGLVTAACGSFQPRPNAAPSSQSDALAGMVVIIDPGHGGYDPGAIGVSGVKEKDVTLSIGLKLRDLLAEAGAQALMTRDRDRDFREDAVPGEATRRRGELLARVQVAGADQAHVFISIHANKFQRNSPWRGAQVFYDRRGAAGSETLAGFLQSELRAATDTKRVHLAIEQFILARAPAPAVTIEVGFLSNSGEEQLLVQADYQAVLAKAILSGVVHYWAEYSRL